MWRGLRAEEKNEPGRENGTPDREARDERG
jgi:hypothetical protein